MFGNIKEKIVKFLSKNKIFIIFISLIILIFSIMLILIFKKFSKEKEIINTNNQVSLISKEDPTEYKEEKDTEEVKMINVDIKGAVSKPGVYSLKEGSIVNDVIKMAGGINKNANTKEINLSKKLKDEMVIVIYTNYEIEEFNNKKNNEKECICDKDINEVCTKESYTNSYDLNSSFISDKKFESTETFDSLVNINTASLEEILSLSGIGESKAKAIIEYRKENKFETIEDIMKVSGIGQSLFDKIKENITV